MADKVQVTAGAELWGGGTAITLLTEAKLKMLLVASGYVHDVDDDLVDAGGANDIIDHELSGTGYTAGYGGAGRKVLASKTITADKTNDRSAFDCADITWTAIDAGTAAAAILAIEDHLGAAGNDTESRIVSHHDTNFPVTTNGGDLTVQVADAIRLTN